MKTFSRLVMSMATAAVLGACASGPDLQPRDRRQCLPGHLLYCEERHDTPALGRKKTVSDYRHCTCEQVRF